MEAFDNLPCDVREALANANHPWAPHWAEWVVGWFPTDQVIERLKRADREEELRREMRLARGEG